MLNKDQKELFRQRFTRFIDQELSHFELVELAEKIMNPYRKEVLSFCKQTTDKAYFEIVSLSGFEQASIKKDDWVYRIPIVRLEKSFRVSLEAIEDGIAEDAVKLFVVTVCNRILQYFKDNQEDGYTFVLRRNLVLDIFDDPTTRDKIFTIHMRTNKIPDINYPQIIDAVLNQGLKYKNEFGDLFKGEDPGRNILVV